MDVDTIKEILEHTCKLVTCPTREIVEAALSYIKVYITVMPSPIVASTLTKLVSRNINKLENLINLIKRIDLIIDGCYMWDD